MSPLPYKDQMFDLIYSLSVFTHLSENHASQWLSEMNRVLKPGGILIITIHGLTALNTIKNSALHQQMFKLVSNIVIRTIEISNMLPLSFLFTNRNFQHAPFVF